MSALSSLLTDDLRQIDFSAFGDRYRNLVEIARQTEEYRRGGAFDEPRLSDRLDDIVFRCRLDPFEALAEEYKRRIRDVKQAQFLGHFLERHPGIQHKAGVPLGGTFILVYHELPGGARPQPKAVLAAARGRDAGFEIDPAIDITTKEKDLGATCAIGSCSAKHSPGSSTRRRLAEDPDVQFVYSS